MIEEKYKKLIIVLLILVIFILIKKQNKKVKKENFVIQNDSVTVNWDSNDCLNLICDYSSGEDLGTGSCSPNISQQIGTVGTVVTVPVYNFYQMQNANKLSGPTKCDSNKRQLGTTLCPANTENEKLTLVSNYCNCKDINQNLDCAYRKTIDPCVSYFKFLANLQQVIMQNTTIRRF